MKLRAITALKLTALLVILACMPAAAVKYVAVVESDVDAASGASADINPAEVRQITAELRRQATENLPLDRYNIMTSETVQSMGGAVLEECADENCVITLGSRIGADYIVRGTISKLGTKLTLTVEMYETDNGTLVITSEPVRAQNIEELLDKASSACGEMYRKFAGAKTQAAGTKSKVKAEPEAVSRSADTKSHNSNAIGLRVGQNAYNLKGELNYQRIFGRSRIEFGGCFTSVSYGALVIFPRHYGKNFSWYIGPAIEVGGFWNSPMMYVDLGAQTGIEYNLNKVNVPLALSLDVRPVFSLLSNRSLWVNVGLGIKYTF